jgi:long-chain fatty acid transport protein
MRNEIRAAAIVAATLLAAPAAATNGMRMIGFGPVQESMGGVGVGATLDASTLASNPAGIIGLGQRIDLGIGYFKPTVSHQATGTPMPAPYPPSLIANDGKTVDSTRGGSPIPAIAYVRPVGERFAAGVGVFAVSGMGVDYPVNLYLSKALTSYLNARLAPGVAYAVTDTLSLGLAVNVMMAQMEYDVAGNLPLPPNGPGQVDHKTATSWGYGATLGVKWTPVPVLSLGAAYETKSTFQDFEFDVPNGKDKLTFDQPQVVTLGGSVRPIETLLVAADVEWIDWSDTMGKDLPKYSQNQSSATPFDMSWKDQWVLKLGVQLTPMKGLDLRAGYNYGKMPLDRARAFENLVFPAVSEHHFTAGAQYAVSQQWSLSLAGMYSPTAKITGANDQQAIASYKTEMSQYQLDVGASYRF